MISDELVVLYLLYYYIANCTHSTCSEEAIAVPFVHKNQGKLWRSVNNARTFEGNVFQQKPHDRNLENLAKNLIIPSFRHNSGGMQHVSW